MNIRCKDFHNTITSSQINIVELIQDLEIYIALCNDIKKERIELPIAAAQQILKLLSFNSYSSGGNNNNNSSSGSSGSSALDEKLVKNTTTTSTTTTFANTSTATTTTTNNNNNNNDIPLLSLKETHCGEISITAYSDVLENDVFSAVTIDRLVSVTHSFNSSDKSVALLFQDYALRQSIHDVTLVVTTICDQLKSQLPFLSDTTTTNNGHGYKY